jgi:hypothetical protein
VSDALRAALVRFARGSFAPEQASRADVLLLRDAGFVVYDPREARFVLTEAGQAAYLARRAADANIYPPSLVSKLKSAGATK